MSSFHRSVMLSILKRLADRGEGSALCIASGGRLEGRPGREKRSPGLQSHERESTTGAKQTNPFWEFMRRLVVRSSPREVTKTHVNLCPAHRIFTETAISGKVQVSILKHGRARTPTVQLFAPKPGFPPIGRASSWSSPDPSRKLHPPEARALRAIILSRRIIDP